MADIIQRPASTTADMRHHGSEAEIRWCTQPLRRPRHVGGRSRKRGRSATGTQQIAEALVLVGVLVALVSVLRGRIWPGGTGL